MTSDNATEAAWDDMEFSVVELLHQAFGIKRYTTGVGDYVFVDTEILPNSVGHNVWNFTPQQFRQCIKDAVGKQRNGAQQNAEVA